MDSKRGKRSVFCWTGEGYHVLAQQEGGKIKQEDKEKQDTSHGEGPESFPPILTRLFDNKGAENGRKGGVSYEKGKNLD